MKQIFIVIIFIISVVGQETLAQNSIKEILNHIEENNTTLKTTRQAGNIQKLDARVGNNLANPDVDFDYMFGNREVGFEHEQTLKVVQEFDFPTAYIQRNKIVNLKDKQVEETYMLARQDVLLEAKLLSIELIYLKKQKEILDKRYSNAQVLKQSYDKRLASGSANVLETNKIALELLNVRTENQLNEVEINDRLQKLAVLNGGNKLGFLGLNYDEVLLPPNFEDYYQRVLERDLVVKSLDRDKGIASREIKLARSMAMPKLSIGYQMELKGPEKFHGVHAGVSIPLWENKNTVKRAKAQLILSDMLIDNTKLQLVNGSRQIYQKVYILKDVNDEYKLLLNSQNNIELLEKALALGQISLLEYFNELIIFYQSTENYLQAERDYHLAVASMMKMDL